MGTEILIIGIAGILVVGFAIGYLIANSHGKNALNEFQRKHKEAIATLGERNKELETKESELKDKDEQISNITKAKQSLEKTLETNALELEERNKVLETKESELRSKDEQISNITKEKQSLEKSLEANTLALEECNKVLATKETELKDKDEQISNTKKEMRSLNKKLVEKQYDLEDKETELKKKKKQLTDTEELLSTKEKENESLKKDVERLSEDLEDREKENSKKSNSLQFVSDILNAKVTSDNTKRDEAVLKIADFIENDVFFCLRENTEVEKIEEIKVKLSKWQIKERKTWLRNKIAIAFIGEFSAGKTSIVNRILSQDDPVVPKLPVDMKATTAIPTYITNSKSNTETTSNTSYMVFTRDHKLKSIDAEAFYRVTKDVLDDVKGVGALIQYFVMSYNNPNLKNISILDTPGFSSGDEEDEIRTSSVINESDALFWVVDVNCGTINQKSISIISKYVSKPLYVVINQCDTKSDNDIDKFEQQAKKDLDSGGVKNVCGFIRFCNNKDKIPLENIMKPIMSVGNTKIDDDYLNEVKDVLEKAQKDIESKMNVAKEKWRKSDGNKDEEATAYKRLLGSLKKEAGVAIKTTE